MRIIMNYDYNTRNDANVLVRAYENQAPHVDEKKQCVGEILFKQELRRESVGFTAWLPRGIAAAVVSELVKLEGAPASHTLVVGIANEFPFTVGVLTSCHENFAGAMRTEAQRAGLSTAIELAH